MAELLLVKFMKFTALQNVSVANHALLRGEVSDPYTANLKCFGFLLVFSSVYQCF